MVLSGTKQQVFEQFKLSMLCHRSSKTVVVPPDGIFYNDTHSDQMAQTLRYLVAIGLEEYQAKFIEHEITMHFLPDCKYEHFVEAGIDTKAQQQLFLTLPKACFAPSTWTDPKLIATAQRLFGTVRRFV